MRWLFLVGLLLATVALRVTVVDGDYERRRRETDVRDLLKSPGTKQARALSLQHPLALADLFWLSAVQEIGRFIEKKQPRAARLRNWAHLATDLDHRYYQVYYGVAVNLTTYNRDADGSDRLLLKGRKHLPHRWEFPFLLGYNAYFIRGDLLQASNRWKEGALLPNAPRFMPSLAARSRFQAGDEREAERLLLTMMEHLQGPHRLDAEIRLMIIRSEPILRAYDAACRAYLEKNGARPESAAVLRMAGLVSYPPQDMMGNPIELDETCRARTELITVREDEAVQRAGAEAPKLRK